MSRKAKGKDDNTPNDQPAADREKPITAKGKGKGKGRGKGKTK